MKPMLHSLATKVSIKDFISLMDKFEIKKGVIVSFNIQTAYGITLVTNENIADFVKKFPKRFIGFGCIDVPAEAALEQLDYAINSLDLSGLKLVPPVQKFDISSKKYDHLWKKMIDLNIPLWTHTGHQISTQGSVAKYGHPLLIDELAMRNTELTIIMGHMGTPWFWDAWSVSVRHPNVYLDISANPELYNYFPWDAFTKYQAENKVLFASDHPLCHWSQIIPKIEELPISEKFKQKIFVKNAEKVLKKHKIL
jgi:predicted TIM-barrel fold metal-dependent hydrolase